MKGHVQRRGKAYRYFFDADADPLTGKRRQVTKGASPPNAKHGPHAERQWQAMSRVGLCGRAGEPLSS